MNAGAGDNPRSELVRDLARARDELNDAFHGLSEEQMARTGAVGVWSVRDVLSHVTSWDEVILPDLQRLALGERPALAGIDLETADFDKANAVIVLQRRSRPLSQVLLDLDARRGEVIDALDSLPDSALIEGQFGRVLVQITSAHDREHAAAIVHWRTQGAP